MNYNYYFKTKKDLCKDRFSTFFIIIIKKLDAIFDSISKKHLDGPPNCFSYFTKVRVLFLNILKLFDCSNDEKKIIINSYDKNEIKNILESCIVKEFSIYNSKSLIKFLKYDKMLEELIILCNFFELTFIYDTTINSYYPKFINIDKIYGLSNNYVTNGEFFEFIKNNCYKDSTLWSNEGLKWNISYTKEIPYFWEFSGGQMYIKKFNKYYLLKDIFNEPVQNISYYEAEAYCNFRNSQLPSIDDLKYFYDSYNTNCQKNYLWEWTRNTTDKFSYCYGGSYYNNLIISDINDISKYDKSAQHYFTGFRLKKKV